MHGHELTLHSPNSGTLRLRRAILLYQDTGSKSSFATLHRVLATDTGPIILPGRSAQVRSSQALARALLRGEEHGFIPQELLYRDERRMIWWVPPAQRRILFRCDALGGDRAAVVPHPGLVFSASASGWFVWALDGSERPTPETRLFRAPYFNVWKDGKICTGSVALPTGGNVERISAWNTAFFDSYFTHANDRARLVRYVGGPVRFWRTMLGGHFGPTFPTMNLVSTNSTLADLIPRGNHA